MTENWQKFAVSFLFPHSSHHPSMTFSIKTLRNIRSYSYFEKTVNSSRIFLLSSSEFIMKEDNFAQLSFSYFNEALVTTFLITPVLF